MVSGIKTLKADEAGRLDVFISSNIDAYTRSYFTGLISDGKVTVNGKVTTKAGFKLTPGDEVTVDIPEPQTDETVAQDIPLDILYEDDDLIIINKPQGMVVHPGAGHHDQTLVNALLSHCDGNLSDINGVIRPGIVHRIDKDTSGVMMAVKNNEMHIAISDMLSRHEIERTYRTVVYGVISEDSGTIEGALARDNRDRTIYKVWDIEECPQAKEAVTHWRVLESFPYVTLVECRLETGRTHQIRVHMKYIGHPLFCDEKYGGCEILKGLRTQKYRQFIENCFALCPRQVLHARTLGFTHPRTGERMFFDSEWPEDMTNLINKWRNYEPNTLG